MTLNEDKNKDNSKQEREFTVNRTVVTPHLIKCFVRVGEHHSDLAYKDPKNLPPNALFIHSWMDATLW